jgi:hypothetical protein
MTHEDAISATRRTMWITEDDVPELREFHRPAIWFSGVAYWWPGDYPSEVMAFPPDGNAWTPWVAATGTGVGQWYFWRGENPEDIHIDQVNFGKYGKIAAKTGGGLDWCHDCQPCRFPPDVMKSLIEAIEKSVAGRAAKLAQLADLKDAA